MGFDCELTNEYMLHSSYEINTVRETHTHTHTHTFNLGMARQDTDYVGIRYIVKEEAFEKSEVILASNRVSKFNCASTMAWRKQTWSCATN